MAKAKSKAMGPALKRFLKKRGRFPKGPKERREAGIMTKADKARSRSSKGKPAKKPAKGKARRTSPGRRKTMARRKMSLPNRLINAALFALAFAGPIRILMGGGDLRRKAELLLLDATAGMVRPGGVAGKFDAGIAASFYGPVAAAFILFEVKKMAMKKFRF